MNGLMIAISVAIGGSTNGALAGDFVITENGLDFMITENLNNIVIEGI